MLGSTVDNIFCVFLCFLTEFPLIRYLCNGVWKYANLTGYSIAICTEDSDKIAK